MGTGRFIIALDMGTTSTKGMLYSMEDGIISTCSRKQNTHFISPRMAEQDPDEVLGAVVKVVRELVDRNSVDPASVAAVVFGGILHSLIPVDREGRFLNRALIWSDMRALEQSKRLRAELDTVELRHRTGCSIHPLYYPPRLLWFREEAQDVFSSAAMFISIKEYVLKRLFGTDLVDRSIASGTGLMNSARLDWDDELLHVSGIRREQLSQVVEPTLVLDGLKGPFASQMGLRPGTPGIIGGADGPLAHLGSVGLHDSRMSLTVGTSAAMRKWVQKPGVIPGSEAWCYYLCEGNWLIGGVIHDAGNVLQWLAGRIIGGSDSEKIFEDLDNTLEAVPPGSEGLIFLPFMSGERSPFYNPSAQTTLIGMTFHHGREHVIRALIEGIAYRIHSVYRVLDEQRCMDLVLTGGILKSPSWMQITADFLGKNLYRTGVSLASAWGAVLLGLRALGVADSMERLNDHIHLGPAVNYRPEEHDLYRALLSRYDTAYEKLYS